MNSQDAGRPTRSPAEGAEGVDRPAWGVFRGCFRLTRRLRRSPRAASRPSLARRVAQVSPGSAVRAQSARREAARGTRARNDPRNAAQGIRTP